MRTLEDLEKLFEEKGIKDAMTDVKALVDAEKQRGISETQQANKEAQALRKYKQAIEKLGLKGDALDDGVSELVKKLESLKDSKPATEFEALAKTVNDLNDRIMKSETEKAQLKQSSARKTLESKLTNALKGKVQSDSFVVKALLNDNMFAVDEDGETVFYRDGDTKLDFSKGVEKFLASNPGIVINGQIGGAGGSGTGDTQKKQMARGAFDALSPADKIKTVKDGIAVVD